jgi:hypothetical protein
VISFVVPFEDPRVVGGLLEEFEMGFHGFEEFGVLGICGEVVGLGGVFC